MGAGMRIAVVGLGTMGLGIVQAFATAGFHVLTTGAQDTARDLAQQRLSAALAARVAKGRKGGIGFGVPGGTGPAPGDAAEIALQRHGAAGIRATLAALERAVPLHLKGRQEAVAGLR